MKIIYVFDPLCVFSYGFNPLIQELIKHYPNIEILPGGLWIKDHVKVVNDDVISNLIKATEKVSSMSGQKFGEAFFDLLKTNPTLDSYYGSKAFITAQELGMDAMGFLSLLYAEVFIYGHHPSEIATYENCVSILDDKTEIFIHAFKSDEMHQLTEIAFEKARLTGIKSYPSLLLIKNDVKHEYPLDYSNFDLLLKWIKQF